MNRSDQLSEYQLKKLRQSRRFLQSLASIECFAEGCEESEVCECEACEAQKALKHLNQVLEPDYTPSSRYQSRMNYNDGINGDAFALAAWVKYDKLRNFLPHILDKDPTHAEAECISSFVCWLGTSCGGAFLQEIRRYKDEANKLERRKAQAKMQISNMELATADPQDAAVKGEEMEKELKAIAREVREWLDVPADCEKPGAWVGAYQPEPGDSEAPLEEIKKQLVVELGDPGAIFKSYGYDAHKESAQKALLSHADALRNMTYASNERAATEDSAEAECDKSSVIIYSSVLEQVLDTSISRDAYQKEGMLQKLQNSNIKSLARGVYRYFGNDETVAKSAFVLCINELLKVRGMTHLAGHYKLEVMSTALLSEEALEKAVTTGVKKAAIASNRLWSNSAYVVHFSSAILSYLRQANICHSQKTTDEFLTTLTIAGFVRTGPSQYCYRGIYPGRVEDTFRAVVMSYVRFRDPSKYEALQEVVGLTVGEEPYAKAVRTTAGLVQPQNIPKSQVEETISLEGTHFED